MFENVPLVGTNSFTLLGRPLVSGARVEAMIESISDTKKITAFKKERRKGYRKSFGSRTTITQCRVTRIVYELTQNVLERAIANGSLNREIKSACCRLNNSFFSVSPV